MIKAEKIRKSIPTIFLFLFTSIAFLRIEAVTEAMLKALSVCATALVPSIFPFLLLTELLLHSPYGRHMLCFLGKPFSFFFRTSAAGGAAYLVGIFFGFPLGVKALAEYRKENALSKTEAERILLFANNTGPAFLIGTVGVRLLGSAKFGLFLYLVQLVISFIFGCFLGFFGKNDAEKLLPSMPSVSVAPFSEMMRNAVLQMLAICGYVAFFSVIGALLLPVAPSVVLSALLLSLLEIGTASSFLATGLQTSPLLIPLLSFAVCFSGLSVYLQSLDFLNETDIKSRFYLPTKLLMGFCAFFLSYLLFPFFA